MRNPPLPPLRIVSQSPPLERGRRGLPECLRAKAGTSLHHLPNLRRKMPSLAKSPSPRPPTHTLDVSPPSAVVRGPGRGREGAVSIPPGRSTSGRVGECNCYRERGFWSGNVKSSPCPLWIGLQSQPLSHPPNLWQKRHSLAKSPSTRAPRRQSGIQPCSAIVDASSPPNFSLCTMLPPSPPIPLLPWAFLSSPSRLLPHPRPRPPHTLWYKWENLVEGASRRGPV